MAAPDALSRIDLKAFAADVTALRKEIDESLGPADLEHLKTASLVGRVCAVVGYLTSWIVPNPISAWLMAQGNFNRWIIAHHVLHGAYDRIEGVPERLTRKGFGAGGRRWLDWLDWMTPAAWEYEHNTLHHYHLGQEKDPDLVERNLEFLRQSRLPKVLRYLIMGVFASVWKFTFYASSTTEHLRRARHARRSDGHISRHEALGFFDWLKPWLPFHATGLEFWRTCVLPYVLTRFVLLPAVFLPLGTWAAVNVLVNLLLAELFANIYSFIIIVPNHSGEDIYRFEHAPRNKAEFYLHQVAGSVNYSGGAWWKDYLQGWLNYQIEHHLWPDLPLSACARAQPRLEALCRQHGVPYTKDNVFARFKTMVDVAVGNTSMKKEAPAQPMPLAPAA